MSDGNAREMLIVTGMSGAGRSTVANALEDLGWYVVDNLPPQMLRPLVDLGAHTGEAIPKIAAVIDVRGGRLFADAQQTVAELRESSDARLVFLDAADAALVRRFEQVRRPHPLQGDGTLLDGIVAERTRMAGLREQSDLVIDTSELNIHQLATRVAELFGEGAD
ncbi:MAG: RNase adapter RapZ, partial [Protaetiibacter sp.]